MSDETLWGAEGREWFLDSLAVLIEDDSLADDVLLYEFRRPELRDLSDYASQVADLIQDLLGEDEDLATETGGCPVLDELAFAATIRSALAAALAAHVDMSEAAWQPTGRTMTVGEARRAAREGGR